ncbi:endonuclease/exonuclease/phosphatase family protein [Lentilactobacillus sp. SPB1-3]|uniref:Endonuclease/exonuclease/phosphatase family protein n=1 Tax=Lentilactobacillus terminaliae TaxID=3003483 RepID=A0ACD5DGB9_9LACO|nr:endonuclease/exonuclease/phosphatase family protein [Lentilactobacillus sp. SPB1-3]MCZ0976712.1 endonuclease/exonuclease/phosphatase family protein [Lentilactobacillus sp. SPB1-3]
MKKIIKLILAVVVVLLLIIGGYVGYVFGSYHRVPDNQKLAVVNRSNQELRVGKSYKAMTFNIGYGSYPHNYTFFMDGGYYSRAFSKRSVEQGMNAFVSAVKSENPDLMLFQEVDTDGDRSHHVNEYRWLSQNLPAYSHVFVQNYDSAYLFYPITRPIGRAKSGIVTLTKTKMTNSTRYQLPIDTNLSKIVDLDRAISVTRIPVSNGKTLSLINVHLSAFTKNQKVMNAQLTKVFNRMKTEARNGNYVIVGGDYNHDMLQNSPSVFHTTAKRLSWTHPFPVAKIPHEFKLVTKGLRQAEIPSVRNNNMVYRQGKTYVSFADGFIVSKNVIPEKVHVKNLHFAHSDHNPVVLNFKLANNR